MRLSPKLDKLLDLYGLVVALIIDTVIVGVCFVVVSPGFIEAVAMALLSLVVVLFGVRAWIKGGIKGRILWGLFAFVALFFDISFVLVSTDVQSAKSAAEITQDLELKRLDSELSRSQNDLADLRRQFSEATKQETMDKLQRQIDAAEATRREAKEDRDQWFNHLQSGGSVSISAKELFMAIPNAATSNDPARPIALVVFAALFFGLQLTIISAATETKSKPAEELIINETKQQNQQKKTRTRRVKQFQSKEEGFVRVLWASYRHDRSKLITTKNHWDKWWSTHGGFPESEYRRLLALAKNLRIISDDGTILVGNEDLAIDMLTRGGMAE